MVIHLVCVYGAQEAALGYTSPTDRSWFVTQRGFDNLMACACESRIACNQHRSIAPWLRVLLAQRIMLSGSLFSLRRYTECHACIYLYISPRSTLRTYRMVIMQRHNRPTVHRLTWQQSYNYASSNLRSHCLWQHENWHLTYSHFTSSTPGYSLCKSVSGECTGTIARIL